LISRWIRDRVHVFRGVACLAASLAIHVLLVYLLAPVWARAITWADRNEAPVPASPVEPSAVVRFVVTATPPPLPEPELVDRILPLDEAALRIPEGTSPEPGALDTPATLPQAPQIAAPWAGQPLEFAEFRQSRQLSDATVTPAIARPLTSPVLTAGGYEGRRADARGKLVSQRGGTPRSEAAVEAGLAWLVAHQLQDGSWRFSHQGAPCSGQCRNSGSEQSTTAATALALLPLLGAGNTPTEGRHAIAVVRGLEYLKNRMVVTPHGGDLQDGTMYGQGLSTIALCEAYAMTGNASLKQPAQQALDFITHAQHFRGGWRYFPGQPGDTTVLGWQWMALRSGQLAGLEVPPQTLERASAFLDSVQSDGGSVYGYQSPGTDRSPTAVGLLCRMYSGWRRSDERLVRGVARLAEWGPSYDDMYFNYYAAQVLLHQEGPAWPAWNERLREHLIASQATSGHEAGSWHFADPQTSPGGRLCDTTLAIMILEVYYRHLPLYGLTAIDS
jgi:hypothetical protein